MALLLFFFVGELVLSRMLVCFFEGRVLHVRFLSCVNVLLLRALGVLMTLGQDADVHGHASCMMCAWKPVTARRVR